MIKEEDKQYLNNPDYSMALEKFFAPEFYDSSSKVQNFVGETGVCNHNVVDTAYPFTNEDIDHVFKGFKSNKVLTVGSSGDQALTALYKGAKDVTVADINLFSKYWIDYKIAAIKNLSYKEFISFFGESNELANYGFNKSVFSKIFHDLDDDSATFWGTIFQEGVGGWYIYNKMLNRTDFDFQIDFGSGKGCSFYGDEGKYNKLKSILQAGDFDLKIKNVDFKDFPYAFGEEKFDTILLSNVCRYVGSLEYQDVVNRLYKNNLADGGNIQLHYIYYPDQTISATTKFKLFFPNIDIKYKRLKDGESSIVAHKPKVMEDEASM